MSIRPSPLAPDAPVSRGKILAWTLFDFANTGFSVMMITLVFPVFFRKVIAGGGNDADRLWGTTISASMLLTALIAPVLGAAADTSNRRRLFLLTFTLLSIACTAALGFIGAGEVVIASALLIVANIGFEGGIVFYDAYLPAISTPQTVGRISGYGFGMGYLGAMAILGICLPLLTASDADNTANIQRCFLITAGFFLLFSLPLFLSFPDAPPQTQPTGKSLSFVETITLGFERVKNTLSHLRDYPNLARFLLAFFIYNDGILTVIAFAGIYAETTLGFTFGELVIFFITIQAAAILGSLLFGNLTDRIGAKPTIFITLGLWSVVVIVAYFTTTKEMFYADGFLAGIAIGSSQSASRSLMSSLTPKHREAEFFGFYDGFCGKASAIIGPLLFGILSEQAGQRTAILSVLVFFIAGTALLWRVEDN